MGVSGGGVRVGLACVLLTCAIASIRSTILRFAVSISLFLAFATFVGRANGLVLGALISILGLIVLNFLSKLKYP